MPNSPGFPEFPGFPGFPGFSGFPGFPGFSGNKRDVLQEAISIVKEIKINQPLQFINFRD